MPDQSRGRDRRDFLRGATAVASTAAGAAAGCLTLLPPMGQQVRYGRVDAPGPVEDEPGYRRWMPAGDVLSAVEGAPTPAEMHWVSVRPGMLGLDELGAEFRIGATLVQSQLDYFGYDLNHFDAVHSLGSLGTVADGNIDTSLVGETLRESGYAESGTDRGWTLFERTDIPRTVAVSESAVVQSTGDNSRSFLDTLLDAGAGRVDRRHERDERFEAFSTRVGSYPTILEGVADGFIDTDPALNALAYTFDDDAAYYIYHQQYADGETPGRGKLKREIEGSIQRAMRAWAVDIEIDEPRVSIEMRIQGEEFREDAVDDRLPYVTWGVDDGMVVTVRHEAGEPVPVDQLSIEPADALLDEPESGSRLDSGDVLRFDTSSFPDDEDTISLTYNYAGTEHDTAALLHYTPDEFDTDE